MTMNLNPLEASKKTSQRKQKSSQQSTSNTKCQRRLLKRMKTFICWQMMIIIWQKGREQTNIGNDNDNILGSGWGKHSDDRKIGFLSPPVGHCRWKLFTSGLRLWRFSILDNEWIKDQAAYMIDDGKWMIHDKNNHDRKNAATSKKLISKNNKTKHTYS